MNQHHNMEDKETYNGRPLSEVVIESIFIQKQILNELAEIKEYIHNLDNKKADKTMITSWEVRITKVENGVEDWKDSKNKVYGAIAVLGLLWPIVLFIADKYL